MSGSDLKISFLKRVDTSVQTGGEPRTDEQGSLNGHTVKKLGKDGIPRDPQEFRKYLVETYGETVTQEAFSGYEDRSDSLKSRHIEKIIDVAKKVTVREQARLLEEPLPREAGRMLKKALEKAGLGDVSEDEGKEWDCLFEMVMGDIQGSTKFQKPLELGALHKELRRVVDQVVESYKVALDRKKGLSKKPLDTETLLQKRRVVLVEDYKGGIPGLTMNDPLGSLQRIRTYLSQFGHDSGVLLLSHENGMTLERKNSSQLSSQNEEELKKQLDVTASVLTKMLDEAGLIDAKKKLLDYLKKQGGEENRIEASKMLEILNRHVPVELSQFGEVREITRLGSGGFGSTFLVKFDGKPYVLKTFESQRGEKMPVKLSLERSSVPNVAMSGYLMPRDDQDLSEDDPKRYLNRVHVVQPTGYMVSVWERGKRQDKLIGPLEMRDLVKKTGSEVWCHGVLMPEAKGVEVQKLIGLTDGNKLEEHEKKTLIESTLKSIKGLNERGFVHRDIKPQNCFFDRKTGTTTLIDTDSLFKTPDDRRRGPQFISQFQGGTYAYMHPRAFGSPGQDEHGTETDLQALGVMALQIDHPTAFQKLSEKITQQQVDEGTFNGMTKDWLLTQLNDEIEKAQPGELKTDLEALRNELNNPKKLSGFAMQCFEKASLSKGFWNDRELSQKMYSQLLDHQVFKPDV